MTFEGKNGREKWTVDAPRRGEKPQEKAQLYIFPTIQEANEMAPKGKKFTADLFLLKAQKPLKEIIFEHSDSE